DMRNMGGLRTKIPVTYWLMIIGTLALTGVGIPGTPLGFAGFFSKDAIIETAWAAGGSAGQLAFWLLVIAAMFTSFYSWRLIHLTFHGNPRDPQHAHGAVVHEQDDRAHTEPLPDAPNPGQSAHHHEPHESPNVMLVPLYILGVGAVVAGVLFYEQFFGHAEHIEHFFQGSLLVSHEVL